MNIYQFTLLVPSRQQCFRKQNNTHRNKNFSAENTSTYLFCMGSEYRTPFLLKSLKNPPL